MFKRKRSGSEAGQIRGRMVVQDSEAAAAADQFLEGQEMDAIRQAAKDAGLGALADAIRCAFMAGYLCGKRVGMEEVVDSLVGQMKKGVALEVEA